MLTTEHPQLSDVASQCTKEWRWTHEDEARRQLLIEIQGFQSQSNKLFGYLNNDDFMSIDVDAAAHSS